MGKLICDSTASSPWKDPTSTPDVIPTVDLITPAWENVSGLEDQQKRNLERLQTKGVLWKHPKDQTLEAIVFRLSHGGDVEADGNCLFTASCKAMGMMMGVDGRELRRRCVKRFVEDLGGFSKNERDLIDDAIRHMYCPDLKCGWGIHVVQELKLVAKKQERVQLDLAIDELVNLGMQRYNLDFLDFLHFDVYMCVYVILCVLVIERG